MSELAQHLLAVIGQRGPVCLHELWEAVETDEPTFDEMMAAIYELLDAHKIEQFATLTFRVVSAA